MATVIFVPGAGLGAWVWNRVLPALHAAGHDVHALTLSGAGGRAHLARPELDLTAWVTDVVAHLETEELRDVVLVGHSFCGTVITGVAERVPQRLARLVYLDALVLDDGRSAFDGMPPEFVALIEQLVREHDGWSLPWFTDDQLAQAFGDHGPSDHDRWSELPRGGHFPEWEVPEPIAADLAEFFASLTPAG